ncbi:hypothetical protein O0L34_g9156 [Tuta absoluta]|nr:hypothetical protein O0L34_g9156 [Tuta absoluta]
MSFLTEYFDEYRKQPIRKIKPCRPEDRFVKLEGIWLDPNQDKQDDKWSDKETAEFVKKTMASLRGQSNYYNSYCAHHDPALKNKEFVHRPRGKKASSEEAKTSVLPEILALKDTEVMKNAQQYYERDLDAPTLKPTNTHARILGYVRPRLYHTGMSEYQSGIARLAFELVRDDRIPRYYAANGNRPRWGYPPESTRQPELDGAPYDGEVLF